jgi:nucleotide-binding universal stress UspA family protein
MREICVAWDDTPHARWALEFAAVLARRADARLALVHVAASVETELIDLGDHGRPRRTLGAAAAALGPDLLAGEQLLVGRPAEQLAAAATRADLLVAGTRPLRGGQRLYAARLRHALLPNAPCPVALVRRPTVHEGARPHNVVACGGAAAFEFAEELAVDLRATVVRSSIARAARACRANRALLVVVAAERGHGLRRRLGRSATDVLVESAPCPVVVARRRRGARPR